MHSPVGQLLLGKHLPRITGDEDTGARVVGIDDPWVTPAHM